MSTIFTISVNFFWVSLVKLEIIKEVKFFRLSYYVQNIDHLFRINPESVVVFICHKTNSIIPYYVKILTNNLEVKPKLVINKIRGHSSEKGKGQKLFIFEI